MLRKGLLICGILSSVLYATMMMVIRYDGYSLKSQTVSELSAIGISTRSLWIALGSVYDFLLIAFGLGIWISANGKRALRIVGISMVIYGALVVVWPFASMHQREVLAAGGGTVSDTLHLILGGITVLLMLVALGFGATVFGKRFKLYSVWTIVMLVFFGALTGLDGPRISDNEPTPWVGVWERINIALFLLWVIVLSATLLRNQLHVPKMTSVGGVNPDQGGLIDQHAF